MCKRMLEGMWALLGRDLRKAVKSIDVLERDLREIKNVLNAMHMNKMTTTFVTAGYIKSANRVLKYAREAYSHVYAASRIYEVGGNRDDVHFAVSQRLMQCQDAITKTLSEFTLR